MPRLKELRQDKKLLARQAAQAAGIDAGMYSRFENYRALPIPADFEKILTVLGCAAADVYDPAEVALLPVRGKAEATGGARETKTPGHYQMTVKLDNECRDALRRDILQTCGYKSISDWLRACVRRLKDQYEIVQKAGKEKPRASLDRKASGAVREKDRKSKS